MLPKFQIKQHTKYAVYTHLFSCILVVLTASLIPSLISSVATGRALAGVDFSAENFDAARFVAEHGRDVVLANLISAIAVLINLPFEYCLIRYYFVLSGTPANVKCSFRVFFSGMENTRAFFKGAIIVFLISLFSSLGIIVGYFPVFLSVCMAPFYLALDPSIGIMQAFKKSASLMKGHKMATFSLCLEFLIWSIVASFLNLLGGGLIATVLKIVSQSLLYTTLAVVFVHLDREKNKNTENENKDFA